MKWITSRAWLSCAIATASVLASSAEGQTPQSGPKPDPQMQAVLEQLTELGGKPIETLTPKEARKQPTPADAVKALLKKQDKNTRPLAVDNVSNKSIVGPGGKIPVRIYTPIGTGPFPVIVYYHGGGWVIADLDTYDASPRALANAAHAVVVSAHYRQGPEDRFPAAHEDAFAAYQWALENAKTLKGDPERIAVVGESAGGNLAAAVAMMARDKNVRMPLYQVLIYPVANHDFDTPSYQENAEAKPLNREMMKWFFANYLSRPEDGDNPWISLIRANLEGLPPATIITAQIDPLRSEGKMLAEQLEKSGVPVTYRNFDGVTHEFFGMGAVVEKSREAVALTGNELTKAFSKGSEREAVGAPGKDVSTGSQESTR